MSIQADLDIGAIAALGPLGAPPSTKYERLIAKAKQVPAATTLVVHPCDETSLRGTLEAGGKNQRCCARASYRCVAL
jgi:hypothetical protein